MKIFNEAGRLTEEGKKVVEPFTAMATDLLSMGETPADTRLIGTILSSIVGDITSNQALKKK